MYHILFQIQNLRACTFFPPRSNNENWGTLRQSADCLNDMKYFKQVTRVSQSQGVVQTVQSARINCKIHQHYN